MPANTKAFEALELSSKDAGRVLGLRVGQRSIEQGQYIPRAEAQSPPELTFANADASKTYLVIALDLDAPFRSAPFLGPIIHWAQPGFKMSGDGGNQTLSSSDPFIYDYIGPAPPPLAAPHRYVFYLYEQPAGLDVAKYASPDGQKVGPVKRMFGSLDGMVGEYGLGECVACNYFESN